MQLVISPTGEVRCIYGEAINLLSFGVPSIQRASHVEPTSHGRWLADLTPVAGPILGPFDRRTDALAAEISWLEQHWLNASAPDSPTR